MGELAMQTKKEENKVNSTVPSENRSAKQANFTGIPTPLKERLEQSTGLPLDDVRVHYNSDLPARLDALAYTSGNQVEVAPGQEQHLPHELGHVVQQKLGIVRANAMHSSGVPLNTDTALERQADEIGAGKKLDIMAAPSSNKIVQRKLLIRTTIDILRKSNSEMHTTKTYGLDENTAVTQPQDQSKQQPCSKNKVKKSQYVGKDTGYIEITQVTRPLIIDGCKTWLTKAGISLGDDDCSRIEAKINSMISKTAVSASPRNVYKKHLKGSNNVPRLNGKVTKEVSYYFESLDEFYRYIFLCLSDRSDESDPSRVKANWLKINVVNTGAGDAIVVTLPEGYLIVDLGSNLTILLNYLGLRKNKRDGTKSGSRGIPLTGSRTCIVITHGDADHMGCSDDFTYGDDDLLQQVIIGFEQYCGNASINSPIYQKLNRFLNSGGFKVYNFQRPRNKHENSNSIVITRRLGADEAVLLTGDQESARLGEALTGLIQEGPPVNHMFVKVSHHGSKENTKPHIVKKLNALGLNADHVISSGKLYGHPSAEMFLNGDALYPQGTQIVHSNKVSTKNRKRQVEAAARTSRFFYTANLNASSDEIGTGSVVYKSNGAVHATYSKVYSDLSNAAATANVGEQTADDTDAGAKEINMVESTLRDNDIEVGGRINGPKPDYADNVRCYLAYLKDVRSNSTQNLEYMLEHLGIMSHVFHTLNEQDQTNYLKQLSSVDTNKTKRFMDSLHVRKLSLQISDVWENWITEVWNQINWGQNFYDIMVRTCSDEFLQDLYKFALNSDDHTLQDKILEAVITYGRQPTQYITLLLGKMWGLDESGIEESSINDTTIQEIPKGNAGVEEMGAAAMSLDSNIIYKLLDSEFTFEGEKEGEMVWVKHRIKILRRLRKDYQIEFFQYLLTCGSLSPAEFNYVLQYLKDKDEDIDIVWNFGSDFFLQALHIYPECREIIYDTYDDILSELDPDSIDELDWLIMNRQILNNELQMGSLTELQTYLKESEMDYSDFINKITPEILKKDIEGDNVFFVYARNNIKEHKEYMAELFNVCYVFGEIAQGLQKYLLILMEDMPNLYELLSDDYLEPTMIGECFDILIAHSAILKILSENPAVFITDFPMLLARIMLKPPKDNPYIIMNWTKDIYAKVAFYNTLADIDPELMTIIFAKHCGMSKEEALIIFEAMAPQCRENLFPIMSLEETLAIIDLMNQNGQEILARILG